MLEITEDDGSSDHPTPFSSGSHHALHVDPINSIQSHLSNGTKNYRRRERSMESFEVVSGASSTFRHGATLEAPNFGQLQMIIASLLLTTVLDIGSALDARNECINQEMYTWMLEFFDDDLGGSNKQDDDYYAEFASQEGRTECLRMFNFVVIPVGVTTWVFGLLSLFIIHRHVKHLEGLSETFNPSHVKALLRLLVPLVIILIVWTYAIFSIMLLPKVNPTLYKQNPFKSLAAVDQMGHIGDNANLYYLSWMCQAQIMILVYQVMVECIRRCRRRIGQSSEIEEVKSFSDHITMHEQIQTMLSFTSAKRLALLYKRKRKKWYQFMLHLRERSGIWVAAFFSSVVLCASSTYVFVQVLVSIASTMYGNNEFSYRQVCTIVRGVSGIPEEFCTRTSFAVLAGGVASCLCVLAMIMHILVRRQFAVDEDKQHSCTVMATQVYPGALDPDAYRCHLGMEFLLSLCLSMLLGLNAVVATGVQGPAATVGNLYYASWLSFLLCLRICLGCLEEIYHVRTPRVDWNPDSNSDFATPTRKVTPLQTSSMSGSEISIDMENYLRMAKKERSSRLRKYLFLSIFSTVCFASACDAAYNQGTPCSKEQKYLIVAPAAVAVLSVIMFLLCLKPRTYALVSRICFGGVTSILCFIVLLVNLIITMHSEDSWAVNGIGEMKLANIYYFSWAAILAAALQMISYIKPLFGSKSKDAMFLVWAGIVKVCMVILGASSHVWYNIRDSCGSDETEGGELAFCSRTKFAIFVAVVGVVSGWSVMASRMPCCSISQKTRNRAEALLSIALVLLFGVAVALITSIGGPGQSVGDLYYSTWLSFWVSIGILVSCFDQMQQGESELEVDGSNHEGDDMRYVDFDDCDDRGTD